MKELSPRQRIICLVGSGAFAFLEACSPGTPQEQVSRDFVNALINGNISGAISLAAPDVRNTPGLAQQLSSLSQLLKGCRVDEVVVRQNPIGGLIGSPENANVTFKEPCGEGGQMFGRGTRFSGINVGLDKTQEGNSNRYYVSVFATTPVPIMSPVSMPGVQSASQAKSAELSRAAVKGKSNVSRIDQEADSYFRSLGLGEEAKAFFIRFAERYIQAVRLGDIKRLETFYHLEFAENPNTLNTDFIDPRFGPGKIIDPLDLATVRNCFEQIPWSRVTIGLSFFDAWIRDQDNLDSYQFTKRDGSRATVAFYIRGAMGDEWRMYMRSLLINSCS